MGSVPDLYTTGDNDPEIEPSRYYRHYLYCDACGSFELDSWTTPDNLEAIEKNRRRLGTAAMYASPMVLVPGLLALGMLPIQTILMVLVAGIAFALVVFKILWGIPGPIDARWRFFKGALLWLPAVALPEWLATEFVPPPVLLLIGSVIIIGLLFVRAALRSKIDIVGRRCAQCGATYAHGTPFFTDLDANPRELTVTEVPLPLGVSPFLVGDSVEYEPEDPPGGLPR